MIDDETISDILLALDIEEKELYEMAGDSDHCMVSKKQVMDDYMWSKRPRYLVAFINDNKYFLLA